MRLHSTQPELPPSASPTHSAYLRYRYTLIALSYRGYWRSRGRPSEPGFILDAAAALSWASAHFPPSTPLILWGQSLGAAVATTIAATAVDGTPGLFSDAGCFGGMAEARAHGRSLLPIRGLVLETPFVSIRRMLASHYPQRWVPYRYLWPFLRSRWDNVEALRRLGTAMNKEVVGDGANDKRSGDGSRALPVLVMRAGKDEVVPGGDAGELEIVARDQGLDVRQMVVGGALHNGVMAAGEGRKALADFVRDCAEGRASKPRAP